MIGAFIVLALTLVEPVSHPIRSHHTRIVKAMEAATRRSATFRGLVERLNRSDLIVYIESGRCPNRHVMSCIAVASNAGTYRYLRVTVDIDHVLSILAAEIAHELGHAAEIAAAPEVIDDTTLRDLYTRIGTTSVARDVFETTNAVRVATQVSLELRVEPEAHAPGSPTPSK